MYYDTPNQWNVARCFHGRSSANLRVNRGPDSQRRQSEGMNVHSAHK